MDKKIKNQTVQGPTKEEMKKMLKYHRTHEEWRHLTPEEEEHWAKIRARIKEMREKGEM